MNFKEFLAISDGIIKKSNKKRNPSSITGAAARMRKGSGIASAVTPADLSIRNDKFNPANKVYNGMSVAGPEYKPKFKKKKYF